jgi:hypothetical protein
VLLFPNGEPPTGSGGETDGGLTSLPGVASISAAGEKYVANGSLYLDAISQAGLEARLRVEATLDHGGEHAAGKFLLDGDFTEIDESIIDFAEGIKDDSLPETRGDLDPCLGGLGASGIAGTFEEGEAKGRSEAPEAGARTADIPDGVGSPAGIPDEDKPRVEISAGGSLTGESGVECARGGEEIGPG